MTFEDEAEENTPGYHPPVSAVKRQPNFTYDEPVRPIAHRASPAEQRRRKKAIKQARDGAQYTRQQKGHSIIKHLILGLFVLYINVIYISVSPNHYWHA